MLSKAEWAKENEEGDPVDKPAEKLLAGLSLTRNGDDLNATSSLGNFINALMNIEREVKSIMNFIKKFQPQVGWKFIFELESQLATTQATLGAERSRVAQLREQVRDERFQAESDRTAGAEALANANRRLTELRNESRGLRSSLETFQRRGLLAWAWSTAFAATVLGLVVLYRGGEHDPTLDQLALWLLGAVVATARNRIAGVLVSLMACLTLGHLGVTHELGETSTMVMHGLLLMAAGMSIGLAQEESDEILAFLFDHTEKREFIYEHVWSPGDFVMWDNRCINHARTDFPHTERRLLRRNVIQGKRPERARIDIAA